ncbi:uncharacterized protein LOC119373695 [Rhipicephalus sanguineus]|uniref:uncharacterized protein LOC119373695 n=1 Tax=Rhipicephalus sanguineus TaxID=34632 RepID=UPI001893F890|nr:uncharacterized protein LOC119373695 [Rhipicephalus sanguineus]
MSALVLHDCCIFADAHYSPSPRCFFTAMRRFSEMTFIDSWTSLYWLGVCLTILSGIVAAYVSARCRLLCSRQTRPPVSHIIMFLVSTLLGKSPSSSLANSQAFRGFVSAFWALGMMVLGFYIQSSITAIRLTPVNVRKIGSIEELERFVLAGIVTPCFNVEWYYIMPSIMENKDNLHLRNVLYVGMYSKRRIDPSTPLSECYRGTQLGTHVSLSVCTDDEIAVASQWDLVPGQHFITTIQAPGINIMNPHRYKNRRLLLAIMEAGLAKPHRKIMQPQGISEQDTAEPFKLYVTPYIVGCGMSFLVFALEVFMQSGLWHFVS